MTDAVALALETLARVIEDQAKAQAYYQGRFNKAQDQLMTALRNAD